MKLVHWPLMGGLLHLVQQGWTGRGRSPPRTLFAVPNVTAHPSTASVPITVWSVALYGFNALINGLKLLRSGVRERTIPHTSRLDDIDAIHFTDPLHIFYRAGGQFGTVSDWWNGADAANSSNVLLLCLDCCHTLVCAMLLLNANLNGQVREPTRCAENKWRQPLAAFCLFRWNAPIEFDSFFSTHAMQARYDCNNMLHSQ